MIMLMEKELTKQEDSVHAKRKALDMHLDSTDNLDGV